MLLTLAGFGRPCAGQTAPADTARRTVQLPAARVEDFRLAGSPPGTFVTELDLGRFGPSASLGAVLAQTTPLVVRQYGPGQLASLSVRGTGPQHVATLWNGFNISFPTLGQVDLSLLPAAALTGATLTHGPDAARSGSGAVGGALTLRTDDATVAGRVPDSDEWADVRGYLTASGGSFGQRALAGRTSVAFRRHSFSTSAQVAQATNDFPYRFRTFRGPQTARQANAATESYSVTHDHRVYLTTDWHVDAAAWLTGANRQVAPAGNTPNTHAREHDASQRLLLSLTHRERTTLRVASLTDVINYADDLSGASDSRSQSWQAQLESVRELWPHNLRLRGGLEAQHFRAHADGYGAGLKTERRAAAFGALTWYGFGQEGQNRLLTTLTVRQAVLPGRWVPLTPDLKVDWTALPAPNLHLWASAARAYRAPTLNERYWRPGGNLNLLPETSADYQVGATIAPGKTGGLGDPSGPPRLLFRAEAVAFDQRIQDWVQWTPDGATGLWSPRNLRRVRSRGLEGNVELRISGYRQAASARTHTTLRLAGQLLQTHKTAGAPADPDPVGVQLPYVPARSGSATLTRGQPVGAHLTLAAELTATATSPRTTNASGTEELPAYGLLNAGLSGEWRAPAATLNLRLDGFNLPDTEYQSQTNRPMPGRAWQVTLAVRHD